MVVYKVLVLGDASVGKTCLIHRLCNDTFFDSYVATLGVDVKEWNVGDNCVLQVWDTAGQERYRSLTSTFYRGAHAIVFCYDITNPASFAAIKQWSSVVDDKSGVVSALVGTKCDLVDEHRKVSTQDGQQLAHDMGWMYGGETSAKSGVNVRESFERLSQELLKSARPIIPTRRQNVHVVEDDDDEDTDQCKC